MSLIDPNLFKSTPERGSGAPFAPGGWSARHPSGAGFRDFRGMTVVVSILLVLAMLASAGYAAATAILEEPLVVNQVFWLSVCFTLPQFIMLMVWIYRANRNAHAMAHGIETTPGWAVGFFFVPILNWFLPYKTMSELWRSAQSPLSWRSHSEPVILYVWWGCWLAAGIGGLVAEFWFDGAGPVLWIASGFSVGTDAITLVLINRIAAWQWANHDQSVFD